MEDARSINSTVEDDLENDSPRGEHGGSEPRSQKLERLGSLNERCLSFTRVYQPTTKKPDTVQISSRWSQIASHRIRSWDYVKKHALLMAYQSIGVVYGDLGTSPTQVLPSITVHNYNLSEDDLLAIFSITFWTLTLLSVVKYVFIVLYADDNGEGGTFALYSNLCKHIKFNNNINVQNTTSDSDDDMIYYSRGKTVRAKIKKFLDTSSKAQNVITFVALVGTCMVIGDGALTPASCVLPALQGLKALSSKITQDEIVYMSVALFIALFAFQRCGTTKIAFCFAPIMILWYAGNTGIGLYNIFKYHPAVLKAISPHYIVKLLIKDASMAWHVLGAVFLCVSGVEALFADLGHFDRRSIQLAYSFIVYPSNVITYAGEIAYLIKYPDQMSNAFYASIPTPVYWPMFVISTLAAVVSSQAMISACFSIVKQSLAHGSFPRVKMIHTSSKHEGHVYSPEVNYILMCLCIGLVVGFKGGVALANALGVVIIWVLMITTCFTTILMVVAWDTHIVLVFTFFFVFVTIEGLFMTSLLNKIPQGGWVPFSIAAVLSTIMLSWRNGRIKKGNYEAKRKMSLSELDQMVSKGTIYRTPGICFFYTDLVNGIPPLIRQYIQHTNSAREIMVLVTVRTLPISTVDVDERLIVGKLGGEGVYRCLVQFGYFDLQNVSGDEYVALVVAKLREYADTLNERQMIDDAAENGAVCVVGRIILKSNHENGWVSRFMINYVYRFIQKNCRSAISSLGLPHAHTMQVGMVYDI